MNDKILKTSDFDFGLDPRLIAQRPAARRDGSRLLRLRRHDGQCSDHTFDQLPQLLRAGDLLVLNDTRVIPARFGCSRPTGGKVDGLFLREPKPGDWEVMLRNAGKCRVGESLSLSLSMVAIGGGSVCETSIRLVEDLGQGRWIVRPVPQGEVLDILRTVGATPLPPYIHRSEDDDDTDDRQRYQTVYASRSGAVAAPTAGLHFTDELFETLAAAGVTTCCLTLHVGAGTFLPVKTEDLASHTMHTEAFELSAEAADAINLARSEGRRVIAVGTTVVRVLETLAAQANRLTPTAGTTDIFIYPPAEFRAVDAMITNFHLPRSTLLMLVSAFCSPRSTDGLKVVLAAYRHAIAGEYRFFSYGDAMLIE